MIKWNIYNGDSLNDYLFYIYLYYVLIIYYYDSNLFITKFIYILFSNIFIYINKIGL